MYLKAASHERVLLLVQEEERARHPESAFLEKSTQKKSHLAFLNQSGEAWLRVTALFSQGPPCSEKTKRLGRWEQGTRHAFIVRKGEDCIWEAMAESRARCHRAGQLRAMQNRAL